ncbi:MAG TPA: hypothetical protein VMM84_14990 [Pyrinomonadaceae bacterium]|nr:hypothetical protein [Pyrinomonadaceae bacterium]
MKMSTVIDMISILMRYRISYVALLLALAILMTLPATADACACCAERGTWFQETARADPEVLAIVGDLGGRLDQIASLYLNATAPEEVKGISLASETFILRRLRPHTREWKLEFTDQRGGRGTLTFTIPDTAVFFGTDPRDGQQGGAGGPLLYKEWRFEGSVSGTGIFKGGTTAKTKFRLVFQGRGNMCRNADDFRTWVLQVRGPRAEYAFYGSINPRANQTGQVGTGSNTFSYDALDLEFGTQGLGRIEPLNSWRALIRGRSAIRCDNIQKRIAL